MPSGRRPRRSESAARGGRDNRLIAPGVNLGKEKSHPVYGPWASHGERDAQTTHMFGFDCRKGWVIQKA